MKQSIVNGLPDLDNDPEMADRVRLDDALCFALYNATNAVIRVYRPLLMAIGLTYPQYLVMMALWDEGSLTVGEIAFRLGLAPNAVTPLVDRLEQGGLVERVRSRTDRRSSSVMLTDKGAELESEAAMVQQAVACNIKLEADRHAPLLRDLKQIVQGMTEGLLLHPRRPPRSGESGAGDPSQGD